MKGVLKFTALGAVALTAALVVRSPAQAGGAEPNGAALYGRCAACHTATGAGVPGAYPPLGVDFRTLAARNEGRRYIALAVIKGLSGPITVEGKSFRGVMPAQSGLDDAAIAAVLNHVGTTITKAGPAFRRFTPAEIGTIRAGGAALSSADVARLHAGAGGK